MLDSNKINPTLTNDLKSQYYLKYINVIYYHICGLRKNRKLDIK